MSLCLLSYSVIVFNCVCPHLFLLCSLVCVLYRFVYLTADCLAFHAVLSFRLGHIEHAYSEREQYR